MIKLNQIVAIYEKTFGRLFLGHPVCLLIQVVRGSILSIDCSAKVFEKIDPFEKFSKSKKVLLSMKVENVLSVESSEKSRIRILQ